MYLTFWNKFEKLANFIDVVIIYKVRIALNTSSAPSQLEQHL